MRDPYSNGKSISGASKLDGYCAVEEKEESGRTIFESYQNHQQFSSLYFC
jgi:hypothetical protein